MMVEQDLEPGELASDPEEPKRPPLSNQAASDVQPVQQGALSSAVPLTSQIANEAKVSRTQRSLTSTSLTSEADSLYNTPHRNGAQVYKLVHPYNTNLWASAHEHPQNLVDRPRPAHHLPGCARPVRRHELLRISTLSECPHCKGERARLLCGQPSRRQQLWPLQRLEAACRTGRLRRFRAHALRHLGVAQLLQLLHWQVKAQGPVLQAQSRAYLGRHLASKGDLAPPLCRPPPNRTTRGRPDRCLSRSVGVWR